MGGSATGKGAVVSALMRLLRRALGAMAIPVGGAAWLPPRLTAVCGCEGSGG